MRQMVRSEGPPSVFEENWEQWRDRWVERRIENPSATFQWATANGERANHIVLPVLKKMTQHHCAFCDAFPVSGVSEETIEHYRPKSLFPEQAYTWENLFYCCTWCQKKNDTWSELLISPDEPDYHFLRYFYYKGTTGEILVNNRAAEEDQERAEETLKVYQLNEGDRPRNRMITARKYNAMDEANQILDEEPYRFIFEVK